MPETDKQLSSEPGGSFGLCLSGGGFRAALYGLGVMRYLAEAGVLCRAAVVCGVSGGSVAAAALGSAVRSVGAQALVRDGFLAHIFDPFLVRVTEADVRTMALRRWLLGRLRFSGVPRNQVLGDVLAGHLFPYLEYLADMPSRPQLIFTATELAAGRAFRFSDSFVGSWDFGYLAPSPDLRVATAVAASVAAPPWIPPLRFDAAAAGFKDAPREVAITDGGVYDNLGIEWFQGFTPERRPDAAVPATDLIVVNASGPLVREQGRIRGLRALNRMRKVQYAQTQATRVRWLVAELESGRQSGLYLGITGDPRHYRLPSGKPVDPALVKPALPSALIAPLAGLRTDFNRFDNTEARLLAYHGYWSTHARVASLRPDQALAEPSWREFADMSESSARWISANLFGRRHRRGIGERLR